MVGQEAVTWSQATSKIIREHAMLRPGPYPRVRRAVLRCAGGGKICYPSRDSAERAARELYEQVGMLAQAAYPCQVAMSGVQHFHLTKRGVGRYG